MRTFSDSEIKNLETQTDLLTGDLSSVTGIDLSLNDLGSVFSATVELQILSLIERAPLLTDLDISSNPLPAEVVLALHARVDEMNKTREHKITLSSEFSYWLKNQIIPDSVNKDSVKFFWLLKEWESTENPRNALTELLDLIRQSPDQKVYYKGVIKKKYVRPNKSGNILFTELLRLPSFELAGILLQARGPDVFVLQFESITSQNPRAYEGLVPSIIVHGLLALANRVDLAYIMADEYLSAIPLLKKEVLAQIAIHEKKHSRAHDLYLEAIADGSITAYLRFAELMEKAPLCGSTLWTYQKQQLFLITGAQKGCVRSMYKLAIVYEKNGDLEKSQYWVRVCQNKLKSQPQSRYQISHEADGFLQNRDFFYNNLSTLIKNIIIKRAELIQERCQNTRPAFEGFKREKVINGLNSLLLKSTEDHLLKHCGCTLIDFYQQKKFNFETLDSHLKNTTAESPLNKGLMSINPEIFAKAFEYHIKDFFVSRMSLTLPAPNHRCSVSF